jgi:nitrogen-specific signal transduction histidine kinase
MLVVELIEPKSSVPSAPETWGLEPLVSTRRSGFGMGLFQARQIIDLHGGEMTFTFDQTRQRLTTRVALPLAAR